MGAAPARHGAHEWLSLTGGLLAAVAVLAAAACGDPDQRRPTETPDAGAVEAQLSPEASRFIADFCALHAPCCTGTEAVSCAAATEALARGRRFDGARAEACLVAVRAASSSASFCFTLPEGTACGSVFENAAAGAPGGACSRSSECSSGDDGDGTCVLQRCVRATVGVEGTPCLGTTTDGVIDLVFGGTAITGALCSTAAGLYCDEKSKTCARRGVAGAPCSGEDVSCVDAAWCPTTTGECAPRTSAGAACEDEYECERGSVCANDGQGGAACTALAGLGDPCERGDECDPRRGLVCDAVTATCIDDVSVRAAACAGSRMLD